MSISVFGKIILKPTIPYQSRQGWSKETDGKEITNDAKLSNDGVVVRYKVIVVDNQRGHDS